MKKTRILIPILLLICLLAGCSGEAREPVPEWPDRLTGEYDPTLTFTLNGEGPVSSGVDSITGRMTALFPAPEGGTLALGWRRVTGAEAELLEDFLNGSGSETCVWETDSTAPNALESYVRLGRSWFLLSASGDGLEEAALLRLVDGTVEAHAGEETALPRAASTLWVELLPWEEDWTCLLLSGWELEPGSGKEALHTLLCSYGWQLADPAAEAAEASFYDAHRSGTALFYLPDETWQGLRLEDNGDLLWNGVLRRPLGEGAGERLTAEWKALAETGVNTASPPPLTLVSGAESVPANLHGTYSWLHITRMGRSMGCESDGASDYDWLGAGCPVLAASGPVELVFPGKAPDRMSLGVYADLGSASLAVTEEGFTPLAGLHTYRLGCTWEREDPPCPGGSGRCTYILLIEGAEDLGPEPGNAEDLSLTIREADAWGASFTLEKRNEGTCEPVGSLYSLFRRTPAGGWDWVEPIRVPWEGTPFSTTGAHSLDLAWEWSYACGVLEPGEYRLQQAWIYSWDKSLRLVSADFTVGEAEPEGPGPLVLCGTPEGLDCSLERLSPHRWAQTVTAQGEKLDSWQIDTDFSLFRLGAEGSFTYLPPAYRLPAGLNESYALHNGRRTLEIDLAAQYGELEAGTYVLRRRVLWFRPENQLTVSFRTWRLVPEERVAYLDTVLTLDAPLSAPVLETEPLDALLYTGEEPVFPVDTGEGWCSTNQAHVVLKTPAYAEFPYDLDYNSHDYTLFFLDGGEWLPLKRQHYFRRSSLNEVRQSPGSHREEDFHYHSAYGSLEAGTYRLVIPAAAHPRKDGLKETEGVIVIPFRITEEGDGVWGPPEE